MQNIYENYDVKKLENHIKQIDEEMKINTEEKANLFILKRTLKLAIITILFLTLIYLIVPSFFITNISTIFLITVLILIVYIFTFAILSMREVNFYDSLNYIYITDDNDLRLGYHFLDVENSTQDKLIFDVPNYYENINVISSDTRKRAIYQYIYDKNLYLSYFDIKNIFNFLESQETVNQLKETLDSLKLEKNVENFTFDVNIFKTQEDIEFEEKERILNDLEFKNKNSVDLKNFTEAESKLSNDLLETEKIYSSSVKENEKIVEKALKTLK